MRVAATIFLIAVVILALFLVLFGALGVSFGIRVGGDTFAAENFGLLRPTYLILLICVAVVGLYFLQRSGRGRT
jgi:hypothetical protein